MFVILQVVRELANYSQDFRVLALSATPGSDLKVRLMEAWKFMITIGPLYTDGNNDMFRIRLCTFFF